MVRNFVHDLVVCLLTIERIRSVGGSRLIPVKCVKQKLATQAFVLLFVIKKINIASIFQLGRTGWFPVVVHMIWLAFMLSGI